MQLKAKLFEVDFGKEDVVLNVEDAKELGVHSHNRVKLIGKHGSSVSIIHTTHHFVRKGYVGIFSKIKDGVDFKNNEKVEIEPISPPESVEFIKKKLAGQKLSEDEIRSIVKDIASKTLSLIDLSAFVSALYVRDTDMDETEALTRAMAFSGEVLKFSGEVYDKHSLGGVPGDKTTLVVVPIIAAAGLTIPKTSSRAITDPAGTADRMEVFAPVSHSIEKIQKIVSKTNGCIVWGGAVNLAPVDDALIQIEHPLSLDPRSLLLASVMSKKFAVGAKFVVIDIPMGAGTKVPDYEKARKLARDFIELGERLGIQIECAVTYGAQPLGYAMGPVLEAIEAFEVLHGKGPISVIEKATAIAGIIFEAAGLAKKNKGIDAAKEILRKGNALKKFREIVKEQGGNEKITLKELNRRIGKYSYTFKAEKGGYVTRIRNKEIAGVAKAAGAPYDKGAGVVLHAKGGSSVKKNGALFTIYAEKPYKLEFAKKTAEKTKPVLVEGMLLEEIPETVISRH